MNADTAVVEAGATGSLDTTAHGLVIGFNFGEEGLMAGASVVDYRVDDL